MERGISEILTFIKLREFNDVILFNLVLPLPGKFKLQMLGDAQIFREPTITTSFNLLIAVTCK